MGLRILTLVLVFMGLLLAGCADKQKEAEELEREMMQKRAAVDSAPDTTRPDTAARTDVTAPDARAVPVEEEARSISRKPPEGDFAVQVAACENIEYARYLVDLYTERGYEPYLTTTVQDGQTFYRVRIGGIATVKEAEALRTEVKDKYSVAAWVDRVQ